MSQNGQTDFKDLAYYKRDTGLFKENRKIRKIKNQKNKLTNQARLTRYQHKSYYVKLCKTNILFFERKSLTF